MGCSVGGEAAGAEVAGGCVPAGLLVAEGVFWGGIRLFLGRIKLAVLPSSWRRSVAAAAFCGVDLQPLPRWDDGPEVTGASAITLPAWARGGFDPGTQHSWPPEIFPFEFQFLFSPPLVSALQKRPSNPLFESRTISRH